MPDVPLGTSLTIAVDRQVRDFEQASKWHVSLPARVVLQQLVLSMMSDRVGLVNVPDNPARRAAATSAIRAIPDLLHGIREQAEPMVYKMVAEGQGKWEELSEIGAILVVQHIHVTALKIKCSCWPQ